MSVQITIEGDDLVVERDGVEARMPAGGHPLARMPHLARAHLIAEIGDCDEIKPVLDVIEAFGCAGIGIKDKV